jgi:tagatose 1,6-diphosphate aldolase
MPWVLLSGGDPYELFRDQVEIACEAGASGFLAGRALWRDYVAAPPVKRSKVIEETVRPRFRELATIATGHGKDWMGRFEIGSAADRWYLTY